MGSDVCDANLLIHWIFEYLPLWQALLRVLGNSSEQTDKAPSVSRAEVVFTFMYESSTPAYLPVVRVSL